MSKKESEWIIEGILKKGVITMMNFHHDNWCDKMKNMSKECNCDPDITVNEVKK